MRQFDVIVVGKGNAALCAALTAGEQGARVAMLEAASMDESGGNSRFAGGVMRFVYDSVEDLKRITEIPDDEAKNADWGSNTQDQFYDDLYRVTSYRTDPDLSEALITKSLDAMVWLRAQGARFVPNYRQSGVVAGKRKFFGRMPIEASGGGPGLVDSLTDTAVKRNIEIFYETRAVSLVYDGERVLGVRTKSRGKPVEFRARAVVLASRRARRSAACSTSTTRAAPDWSPARCSAGSPGPAPHLRR